MVLFEEMKIGSNLWNQEKNIGIFRRNKNWFDTYFHIKNICCSQMHTWRYLGFWTDFDFKFYSRRPESTFNYWYKEARMSDVFKRNETFSSYFHCSHSPLFSIVLKKSRSKFIFDSLRSFCKLKYIVFIPLTPGTAPDIIW